MGTIILCQHNSQEEGDFWYIDSGCSNYITRIKTNFISLDKTFKSEVKLGDGRRVKVEGKGESQFNLKKITLKSSSMCFMYLLYLKIY